MMPNFWQLATTPILKIQNFHFGMFFFGKIIYDFVSPAWKLDNPYYHNWTVFKIKKLSKDIWKKVKFQLKESQFEKRLKFHA